MSEDTKIIDLRQASLSRLLDHLGGLVEAIQRSNTRYLGQEKELGEMNRRLRSIELKMEEGFRDVRSDLVLMENRLLSAEHLARRGDSEDLT